VDDDRGELSVRFGLHRQLNPLYRAPTAKASPRVEGRRSPKQEDDRSEAQPEGPPSRHRRLIADPDEPYAGGEYESRSRQLQEKWSSPLLPWTPRARTPRRSTNSAAYIAIPPPSAKGLADPQPPSENATPALTIRNPEIEARMTAPQTDEGDRRATPLSLVAEIDGDVVGSLTPPSCTLRSPSPPRLLTMHPVMTMTKSERP
jgi:hypothetical protein